MTNQTRKSFAEYGVSLNLERAQAMLCEVAGDGPANMKLKSCAMLVLLTLALSVVSVAQSAADTSQEKSTTDQAQAASRSTAVERESWRQTIIHIPLPKEGCSVAAFPETQCRETQCKPPSTKLYPPPRPAVIRQETVGGGGPTDFSAVGAGHLSDAEGDRKSGV